MKNKKIIPLTITIVAVALMVMLGLSKFFETSWQNENTVDNVLSVNTNKSDELSNFDYPYLDYEGLINSTDKKVIEK